MVALCARSPYRRHEPAEQIDRERPEHDPDKGLGPRPWSATRHSVGGVLEADGLVGDTLRLGWTSGMPPMMTGRPAIGKP